jgi:hypothetical protein
MKYDPIGDCYTAESVEDIDEDWRIIAEEEWKDGVHRLTVTRGTNGGAEQRLVYVKVPLPCCFGVGEHRPGCRNV